MLVDGVKIFNVYGFYCFLYCEINLIYVGEESVKNWYWWNVSFLYSLEDSWVFV